MEGDSEYEYEDGECVWAKYADYPWWPGQIELPPKKTKRGRKPKHKTIQVRWFGEFGVPTNAVQKRFVIPWDPDEIDRVYVEVDEEDVTTFQESVDECNTVYMQLCEEQGVEPLESAVVYDKKDAQREKTRKTVTGNKKKKISKSRKTKNSSSDEYNEVESGDDSEQEEKDLPPPPGLEPFDDTENATEADGENGAEEEEDEEEDDDVMTERKRSLRSASKPKPEVVAKAKPKTKPKTKSVKKV
eukprot:CAMPEP_0202709692 /NCGR_PEP_ID=MMETSP1385-20130828/21780_1 /ASSEMBLY_ACC=CAM_ASM_000861 /TAXON_ID=933848 /ORGANISM="Elphidium margaritaceum" /LENGTH=243 /DNA_ID=CAMNT_0049369019 /DNA_START=150 /DNA_END=878 /DNA_ORIENTATION=+